MRLFAATLLCGSAMLAAAAPLDLAVLASKKNIYLSTCTLLPDCLLIICDTPDTIAAAAYYANGAASTNTPSETTIISKPAKAWEGTTRQGTLDKSAFSANIDAGAKALAKGEIAGQAVMGSEEFLCFRDGTTKFTGRVNDGLLGTEPANCVADYWCASLS